MNQVATFRAPDVKQEEEEDKTINVKVVSSSGDEVFFKVRYTAKLYKLQDAFASKVGKDVYSIRFSYDEKQIDIDDYDNTPASLKMEDNAVIDAMVQQWAG